MLKVLDFEELNNPEPTYTFTVEAVDEDGVMPPGVTSVTVTIKVGAKELLLGLSPMKATTPMPCKKPETDFSSPFSAPSSFNSSSSTSI